MKIKKNTELTRKCICDNNNYDIIDVFDIGDLTDQHIDLDISEQDLAQRYQYAVENSKRMGGTISSGFAEDLGIIISPKMTWEDFIVITLGSKVCGIGNNDWGSPRSRPLFYGQYLPKKKLNTFKALVLVDRSSSHSKEDATYAISQIQILGLSISGYVVCFDTSPHYESVTNIISGEINELLKIQYTGSGGTRLSSTIYSYEEEVGAVDLVIVITDGGIFDLEELIKRGQPNNDTHYLWILTAKNDGFMPPFGRAFNLKN